MCMYEFLLVLVLEHLNGHFQLGEFLKKSIDGLHCLFIPSILAEYHDYVKSIDVWSIKCF